MLDREFDEIRNGTLETLPGERKHQILSKALEWAAAHYDGWELYRHLKDSLGMEDQEISRAGFELDEFYEDEAPEDETDYEPEDDYEEDCDEELYADAKCQLSMLYDADPAHVEEQRQKGIAEADKLIANKVLEAIRTMLRKDRETGAFEYAEARKAYYTERLICEILMALEQNAVNMGMEYDDCQKAMGGDLSKAAKKDWYLRHKDRGMEP